MNNPNVEKNPKPPEVGDLLTGPPTVNGKRTGRYEVRAVVDGEPHGSEYGWEYQLVLRYRSRSSYRYVLVNAHDYKYLYKPVEREEASTR